MAGVAPYEDLARHHLNTVRRVYQARSSQDYVDSIDAYYFRDVFRRDLFRLLQRWGLLTILRTGRVLDVGCGTAWPARVLLEFGMDPARYCGVDFVEERLRTAQHLCPTMQFVEANGLDLPFQSDTADLLCLFQVFAAIQDADARRGLATECMRVLKTGGYLIYWDAIPWHPVCMALRSLASPFRTVKRDAVKRGPIERAVSVTDIHDAFRGIGMVESWVTTGLIRDVSKRLLPVSFIACDLAQRLPILQSYALYLIRKSPAQQVVKEEAIP